MKKIFLVAISSLLFSACSTMVFENKDASASKGDFVVKKWHHNWILDLHEGSSPANLDRICKGKQWKKVKIEESFLNGFITLSPVWYPDTVTIICGREEAD